MRKTCILSWLKRNLTAKTYFVTALDSIPARITHRGSRKHLRLASGDLAQLVQQQWIADARRVEVVMLQCKYVSRRMWVSGLPEQLRQLCELASKETDRKKLFALVAEIDRLFQKWKNSKAVKA